ncbi:MAG: AIPR family protein [Gemmatimonadales bacterium]|nr:AIPR family protein [Gemmatimonadales bacterium]
MPQLDLTYPTVLGLLKHHLVPSRTESRAFVAWFLEHFYRLEDSEAQDAVCDGPDDKGVDAIFVDENLERIEILQGKLFQNSAKTLGDAALKEFAGALDQFRTRAGVEAVQAQTANTELASLLREAKVADLVEQGYEIRGVFVTNVSRDANAKAYLVTRTDITVFDAPVLDAAYVPAGNVAPTGAPVTFDIAGYDVVEYKTPEAIAFVAPLLASELVTLDGLSNGALFSWNVRQSLGRTKVNRAIAESVKEQAEHKNFLLYHNGLTVLCEKAELAKDRLTVTGYTVVNGCQSLTTLYEQRKSISSELRLLARVIQLPPDSDLASKITRHSNHQNAIGARDLQSNSSIQRRLQAEFSKLYPGAVSYEIKRGEISRATLVIGNDEAAKVLLAFDREQPSACHQTYRHFDEMHGDIFARPEVDAPRIRALYEALECVRVQLPALTNQLLAHYRLVQYFLLYLLRRALETDADGQKFVKRPQDFLAQPNGLQRINKCLSSVLSDLIVDLNAELKEREENGAPFDYKRELKSPTAVKALAGAVVPMYEKAVKRGRVESFASEWAASVP